MTHDMQCDEFVERLADLLERDVDEMTRAALESHALACGDCGPLLADMRKLRIDASNLPALAPSRDLWEGISRRIDAPVIPLHAGEGQPLAVWRRWRRWAPMAAAAVLLVAVTATSTYYLTRLQGAPAASVASNQPRAAADSGAGSRTGVPQTAVTVAKSTDDTTGDRITGTKTAQRPTTAANNVRFASAKPSAEQVYASEIARLHAIVERRRSQLDPVTISVIERNLKVIDDAIVQCKLALTKDPASRFLMESLNNALESKVELLRTATMLPARS